MLKCVVVSFVVYTINPNLIAKNENNIYYILL